MEAATKASEEPREVCFACPWNAERLNTFETTIFEATGVIYRELARMESGADGNEQFRAAIVQLYAPIFRLRAIAASQPVRPTRSRCDRQDSRKTAEKGGEGTRRSGTVGQFRSANPQGHPVGAQQGISNSDPSTQRPES